LIGSGLWTHHENTEENRDSGEEGGDEEKYAKILEEMKQADDSDGR